MRPESGKATTSDAAAANSEKQERTRRKTGNGEGDGRKKLTPPPAAPPRASQTVFGAKPVSPLAEKAAAAEENIMEEMADALTMTLAQRQKTFVDKSPRQSLSIPQKNLAYDYAEKKLSISRQPQDIIAATAAAAIQLQIALDEQKNYANRLLGKSDDEDNAEKNAENDEQAAKRLEEDEERVKQQRAAAMQVENPHTYELQDRIYKDLRAKAMEVGRFIAEMDNTHRELAQRIDKVRPTSEVQAMLNTLLNSLSERDVLFTLCLDEQQRESKIVLQVQPAKAETSSAMRRKVLNAVYRYDGINRKSGENGAEIGEPRQMVEFEDIRKQLYENFMSNQEIERAVMKIISTMASTYEREAEKTAEQYKKGKERLTFLEKNIEHLLRFDGSVDFRHLATLTDGIVPSALLRRASELYDEDDTGSPISKPGGASPGPAPDGAAAAATLAAAATAPATAAGADGQPRPSDGEAAGAEGGAKSEEVTENDLKNLTFDELIALNLDMRKLKRENVDLRRKLTKGDKLYRLVCEQEVEMRQKFEKNEKTTRRMQRDYIRSRQRLEEAAFYIENQLWQNGEEFHFTDEDNQEVDIDDVEQLDEKFAKMTNDDVDENAQDAAARAQAAVTDDDEDEEKRDGSDADGESGERARSARGRDGMGSFTVPDVADYAKFFDHALLLAPNESFRAQTLDIKQQLTKLVGGHKKFQRWLASSKRDCEVLHSAIWLVLSYFEREIGLPADSNYRALLDAFEQLATSFKDNQTFVKTVGNNKQQQKQKLSDYASVVARLISSYNDRVKQQKDLDSDTTEISPSIAHLVNPAAAAGAAAAAGGAMDSEQMLRRMHQIRRRGEELEKANQVLNRKVLEVEEKLKSKEKQMDKMQQLLNLNDGKSAGQTGGGGGKAGKGARNKKSGKGGTQSGRSAAAHTGGEQSATDKNDTPSGLTGNPSVVAVDNSPEGLATQISDLEAELEEVQQTCSALQIKFDLAVEQRNEAQSAEAELRRTKNQLEAELTALQLRYGREKQETTILRRTNHSLRVSIMSGNGNDSQDMAQRLLSVHTDGLAGNEDDMGGPYYRTVAVQVTDDDLGSGGKRKEAAAVANKKVQCDILTSSGGANSQPHTQSTAATNEQFAAPLAASAHAPSAQRNNNNNKELIERAVSKPGLPVYNSTRDSISQTTNTDQSEAAQSGGNNMRRLSRAFSVSPTTFLPAERSSSISSPTKMLTKQHHHQATVLPSVAASTPNLALAQTSSIDMSANNTVMSASQAVVTVVEYEVLPVNGGKTVQKAQQQQQNTATISDKIESRSAPAQKATKLLVDKAILTDPVALQPLEVIATTAKEPKNLSTTFAEPTTVAPTAAAPAATAAASVISVQKSRRQTLHNSLPMHNSLSMTDAAQFTAAALPAAAAGQFTTGQGSQPQYQPFTFEMLANEKALLKLAAMEATRNDRVFGLDLFLLLRNERLLASGDAQVQTEPLPKRMQSTNASPPVPDQIQLQQRSVATTKTAVMLLAASAVLPISIFTTVAEVVVDGQIVKIQLREAQNQAGPSTFCDFEEQEVQTDIQMYRKARRAQQEQRSDGLANTTTSDGTFFSADGLTANHQTEEILAQLPHPLNARPREQAKNVTKAHQIYQLAAQYIDNPQQIMPPATAGSLGSSGSSRQSTGWSRLSDALRRSSNTKDLFIPMSLNSKPPDGARSYGGLGTGVSPLKSMSPPPPPSAAISGGVSESGAKSGARINSAPLNSIGAAAATNPVDANQNRTSSYQEKLQQFLHSPLSRSPPTVKVGAKSNTAAAAMVEQPQRRHSGGQTAKQQGPFDLNAVSRLSGTNPGRTHAVGGVLTAAGHPAAAMRARHLNPQQQQQQHAGGGVESAAQSGRNSKRFMSAPPQQQSLVLGGTASRPVSRQGGSGASASARSGRGGNLSSALREVVKEFLPDTAETANNENTSPTFGRAHGRSGQQRAVAPVASAINASRPASASRHGLQQQVGAASKFSMSPPTAASSTTPPPNNTMKTSLGPSPPVRKLPNLMLSANFGSQRKR